MSRAITVLITAIVLCAAGLGGPPKTGDRAPDFNLQSAAGPNVALKDYQGKSKVVLVFYRGYW